MNVNAADADRFEPFDVSVFRPHTWGALGKCAYCKRRPAAFMKVSSAGRWRTPTWHPFCIQCRDKLLEKIGAAIAAEGKANA